MNFEELIQMVLEINEDNARMKKRIAILEGHLGLDEIKYLDLQEIGVIPFCDHVNELKKRADSTRTEEMVLTLRRELERKGVMRTKDVMNLFSLKHYEQARRIMKKVSEAYIETIFEIDTRKSHRLRLRNYTVNNVRTIQDVNRMCAHN